MTNDNNPWRTMDDLMALAVEHGASDLHLKAGRPPLLRIHGVVETISGPPLEAEAIRQMSWAIMDERARRAMDETGSADFSHTIKAGDRFRLNVFRERGQTAVAARRVSRFVGHFSDLHLPADTMARMCRVRQGLIVFAGTTGCGKSTSIASCLAYINETRQCHVVTIEDPIEYLFEDNLAFINQREIGPDVPTYELALRYLLREDPDVVMVGELRDKLVVEAVLRAAETTRLVFTTVHAGSAGGVVTRILDWFTPDERPLIQESLASNLVAIICQKLVPCLDPDVGRVPSTEVLLSSPTVRKTIREGDAAHLATVIQADNDQGMHDFTQDLARLIREQLVDPKVAYEMAPNPEALRLAIRGIAVKKGTIR